MLCALERLLEGCLQARGGTTRVALLIEGFPRPYHPITEFAKLLFLLHEHRAKATFVVDWNDIRERGLGTSVADMMQMLKQNEHEVAIRFHDNSCAVPQLRQHAVEALHFLQRVYGITVVSAKVGCRMSVAHAVDDVDAQRLERGVHDSDDVLNDLEMALHDLRGRECVCVSQLWH